MGPGNTTNWRGGWVGPRAPAGVKVKRNPTPLGDIILVVVCFLLGDSPASEFYKPTFRNTLSVPSS
jgi:hypothetical protein